MTDPTANIEDRAGSYPTSMELRKRGDKKDAAIARDCAEARLLAELHVSEQDCEVRIHLYHIMYNELRRQTFLTRCLSIHIVLQLLHPPQITALR